jgi:hypothetical protein
MEETTRDFKREAPGRKTNSSSTTTVATAIKRRLEETFTAPSLDLRGASFNNVQRSFPAGLVEEVQYDLAKE